MFHVRSMAIVESTTNAIRHYPVRTMNRTPALCTRHGALRPLQVLLLSWGPFQIAPIVAIHAPGRDAIPFRAESDCREATAPNRARSDARPWTHR